MRSDAGRWRIVLFDLDDTLYEEATYVVSGFWAVARHLERTWGWPSHDLVAEMLEILSAQGRGRVFDELLAGRGLSDRGVIDDLVKVYRMHRPQITLYPEAILVLSRMRERGTRIGLVTDGKWQVQQRKVRTLGVERWLDAVLYTDRIGREYWKPQPKAFELALQKLGGHPREAIYVGNDPTKDFQGPKAIGMSSVHVVREGHGVASGCSCPADYHVSKLTDVSEIVEGA